MKTKPFVLSILALLSFGIPACSRHSDTHRGISTNGGGSSSSNLTASLKLKKGMQIKLSHNALAWGDQWIPLGNNQPGIRTISILNPSDAEGLAYTWSTKIPEKGNELENNPKSAPMTSPEGEIAPPHPQLSIRGWEGKMTLANAMASRRMTLPIFWPEGELYLSNASGIWLSDSAFEELKTNRKTEWQPGILDNPLLGPVQGLTLLEKGLNIFNNSLDNMPEKLQAAKEIKAERRLGEYGLKINGVDQVVETVEAENWLVHYKILDNAQNPLILEVKFLPKASLGETIFSPLTLLKGLLDYRVTEIDQPNT